MSAYSLYHELGHLASDATVVVDTGDEWVEVVGFRQVDGLVDDYSDDYYEVILKSSIPPKADTCRAVEIGPDDTYDPEGDDFGIDYDYSDESPPDGYATQAEEDAAWDAYLAEQTEPDIDAELSDEVRSKTILNLANACAVLHDDSLASGTREAIRDEIMRILG